MQQRSSRSCAETDLLVPELAPVTPTCAQPVRVSVFLGRLRKGLPRGLVRGRAGREPNTLVPRNPNNLSSQFDNKRHFTKAHRRACPERDDTSCSRSMQTSVSCGTQRTAYGAVDRSVKPKPIQRSGVPNRCSVEHLSSNVPGVTARLRLDDDFVQGQLGSGHPRNY